MPDSFANSAVAADMVRIFEPLANRTLTTATLDGRGATVERADSKRRLITFAAPALVLIAAAGLSIAYVTESWMKRMVAVTTRSQTPRPQQTALPDDMSAGVSAASNQAQGLVLPKDASVPDGRVVVSPASSAGSRASVKSLPQRATTTFRVGAAERSPVDVDNLPPRPGGTVQRTLDRRDGSVNLPRCMPGSNEDRCIYQDVLNADARLRTAFNTAQRAGVSNAQLATIRARWNAARRDADDDPDGTIWQYNRLATALDRMARSDLE